MFEDWLISSTRLKNKEMKLYSHEKELLHGDFEKEILSSFNRGWGTEIPDSVFIWADKAKCLFDDFRMEGNFE